MISLSAANMIESFKEIEPGGRYFIECLKLIYFMLLPN